MDERVVESRIDFYTRVLWRANSASLHLPRSQKKKARETRSGPNPRQNIVVVSTQRRIKADRYCRMPQLRNGEMIYEFNAYELAPYKTATDVIRGIPIEDGPEELDREIVNS
ncbi:hypothetical protein HPB50_014177 [Hyalomma asiaticum]|uniref:Uncharacterized protein n=1 Tax=Hyalomma asiaticum TaxID=266040 RepID=A0ACB7SQ31_HYAAI|nr:hypothetical protein HPB50_014177 [Hyalomma asiaticum]